MTIILKVVEASSIVSLVLSSSRIWTSDMAELVAPFDKQSAASAQEGGRRKGTFYFYREKSRMSPFFVQGSWLAWLAANCAMHG